MAKNQFEQLKQKAREIPEVREYLDSDQARLGREIFKRRNNKRLSRSELSKQSNVSLETLSKIESGDPSVDWKDYEQVFKKLNNQLEIKTFA
ncbi:helix-turn-helix domain-containing protein [Sporolactobacillus vineae]|uniref:helix-turn-helix domain-containing protein n=1 Tax=Sporolactobacillus vineae TaxID=444463 RepID=UPI00028A1FF0|nr:helix-turn-helix transcriptional regulator [Sporolactobacillus vineae]